MEKRRHITHGFGFHKKKGMKFNAVLNALLTTVYTSNVITVKGVPIASAISIAGGTYSKNGGGYTASAGTVSPGDTVSVRGTSSGADSTLVTVTLTIATLTLLFKVTTGDHVPNAFSFVDINPGLLSTIYTSNTIVVTGTTIPSVISISGAGATYNINGGAFTASAGTVNPSDNVQVKNTSSASDTTVVNSALTIGGVSDTFTITTGDHVPTAFSFVDQTNVALSTAIISAPITVAGITIPSVISISGGGGDYRINGGSFTASAGTVNNGDTVEARVTSSGAPSTGVSTTVTIGGISDTFTATTTGGGGGTTGTSMGLLLALTYPT